MVMYGTVTIDTATGKVLSADVTVAHVLYYGVGGFTEYVLDHVETVHQTLYQASRGGPVEVLTQIWINGSAEVDGPNLYLTLEGSLVGFNGSPLFSGRIPVGFGSSIDLGGTPYGWTEFPYTAL